jgi:ABC-2 type transport system ATP-binding protein
MILYDLLSEGVAIIVSTAYLDEAERCNRVALMNDGRFMTVDAPSRIKESIGGRFIVVETDAAREAEPLVAQILPSSHITRTGNSVRIFTRGSGRDYTSVIRTALSRKKIHASIRYAEPSLEDCFNEWMRMENESRIITGKKSSRGGKH